MTETMDAGLDGLTREQLLEICRGRGLAATAWKRGRMLAVLKGEEQAPEPRRKTKLAPSPTGVLAAQLRARADEDGHAQAAAKARANMEKRTGRCLSKNGCACEAYEPGARDAFGWQMCECQHTQWAHEKADR